MIINERLTFGQTYVVQSDGPITITQTGAHGTLKKVDITDAAGTAGREVVFTAIDTAAEVEVDAGTNWSCVPGFNRGAASAQGGTAELPAEQVAFLQAVTDGKLTFDADGRLKIATSVDAAGTFNHDGYASNYTKTVDGVKYTTTVSANEVKVTRRENGTDTVVMHLTNGELSLQGARVLTQQLGTLVSGQAAVLANGGVYSLSAAAEDGFDLSALTLAEPPQGGLTTARVVLTLVGIGSAGPQVFPTAWWVGEPNGDSPLLAGGSVYHLVLERDARGAAANVAYSKALA